MIIDLDYATALKDHGFSIELDSNDELYRALTGFDYKINDVLKNHNTPFDIGRSEIRRQPNNLNCLLHCELQVRNEYSLDDAANYLMKMWYKCLSHEKPLCEKVDRSSTTSEVLIRILTISKGTACTLEFVIRK